MGLSGKNTGVGCHLPGHLPGAPPDSETDSNLLGRKILYHQVTWEPLITDIKVPKINFAL